jgi:hypothetical protein
MPAGRKHYTPRHLAAETLTERFAGESLPRYHDLDALAGTWSAADLRGFEKSIGPLTRIDEHLWTKRRHRK